MSGAEIAHPGSSVSPPVLLGPLPLHISRLFVHPPRSFTRCREWLRVISSNPEETRATSRKPQPGIHAGFMFCTSFLNTFIRLVVRSLVSFSPGSSLSSPTVFQPDWQLFMFVSFTVVDQQNRETLFGEVRTRRHDAQHHAFGSEHLNGANTPGLFLSCRGVAVFLGRRLRQLPFRASWFP